MAVCYHCGLNLLRMQGSSQVINDLLNTNALETVLINDIAARDAAFKAHKDASAIHASFGCMPDHAGTMPASDLSTGDRVAEFGVTLGALRDCIAHSCTLAINEMTYHIGRLKPIFGAIESWDFSDPAVAVLYTKDHLH